jgi:Ca-activated chloride channel family protein
VIVLLSDGRRTTGPDPIEVARMAADRGVRVYTVGFGTVRGTTIGVDGWSAFVQLDEETLKSVADITRGEYFHADSAAGLEAVYRELNTRLVMERRETEVGALFSAAAAALAVVAALASIAWSGRIR